MTKKSASKLDQVEKLLIRCAIYTRKSSDEGLEQSFNSLDAQREAGEAYVKSQASEGWQAVDTRYDDGGFSGGTMERPGLQRLLVDIEAGLIDVVVVYKIDRLSALAIERVIYDAVARWSGRADQPLQHVRSVRFLESGLAIELPVSLAAEALLHLELEERVLRQDRTSLVLYLPLQFPLRGGRSNVTNGGRRTVSPDRVLIAALRKAYRMTRREGGLPLVETAPVSPYERSMLRLAFLAPNLQRDILAGHQPAGLNLERLIKMRIPLAWSEQRAALGWTRAR